MSKLAFFFFLPFLRRRDNNKIIFSAEVEFQHKWKREGYSLREGRDYKNVFGENGDYNLERFNSKDVESTIIKTIEHDLQEDIYDIFGYDTKVKINKVSYGSITVIFTVLAATYYGISKYKNFIESCELIKKQAQKLLSKRLDDNFGDDTFAVSVDIEQPQFKRRRFIDMESGYEVGLSPRNQRDGFFYFLLVGFLTLATILGILVYHSFMQTYFK